MTVFESVVLFVSWVLLVLVLCGLAVDCADDVGQAVERDDCRVRVLGPEGGVCGVGQRVTVLEPGVYICVCEEEP